MFVCRCRVRTPPTPPPAPGPHYSCRGSRGLLSWYGSWVGRGGSGGSCGVKGVLNRVSAAEAGMLGEIRAQKRVWNTIRSLESLKGFLKMFLGPQRAGTRHIKAKRVTQHTQASFFFPPPPLLPFKLITMLTLLGTRRFFSAFFSLSFFLSFFLSWVIV